MTAKKLPAWQKNPFSFAIFSGAALLATSQGPAMAQSAPVPGAGSGSYAYQQPQASTFTTTAPVEAAAPATPGKRTGKTKYQDLPLTTDTAKYRLDELRALLSVSRPEEVQGSIQELCEWLNDAADAHYRMFLAFSKSDLTKPQATSEKQLNLRFGQLKREAQLLRADLLIKQLRAPEALAPLVDIVAADPRSATGQQAYKRLVDLGFSQAVAAAAPATATSAAAPTEGPTKLPAMIPAVAPSQPKAELSPEINALNKAAAAPPKKPAPAKVMTTAGLKLPSQK